MKIFLLAFMLFPFVCKSQITYEDSLNNFQKLYVKDHEVVKGDDKKMMQFYPVGRHYQVTASFEKKENSEWFLMATSGNVKKQYRVYGILTFQLDQSILHLTIYQSKDLLSNKEFSEYLFIPFTDKTSGVETYGGGRYMDLTFSDIHNSSCVIDFNKAYNPYCAYVSGYNCPLPPKENDLQVSIMAGEKNYLKH